MHTTLLSMSKHLDLPVENYKDQYWVVMTQIVSESPQINYNQVFFLKMSFCFSNNNWTEYFEHSSFFEWKKIHDFIKFDDCPDRET